MENRHNQEKLKAQGEIDDITNQIDKQRKDGNEDAANKLQEEQQKRQQ